MCGFRTLSVDPLGHMVLGGVPFGGPGQILELFVMFLEPLLNSSCGLAGYIILLVGAPTVWNVAATREGTSDVSYMSRLQRVRP